MAFRKLNVLFGRFWNLFIVLENYTAESDIKDLIEAVVFGEPPCMSGDPLKSPEKM